MAMVIILGLFAVIGADDPCKDVPEPHDIPAVGQRWQYAPGCQTCSGKACIGCAKTPSSCARCVYDFETCKRHDENDCRGIINGAKLRNDPPCRNTSFPFLPKNKTEKDPGYRFGLADGDDLFEGNMSYYMAKNRCANYRNASGLNPCAGFTWFYSVPIDQPPKAGQTYYVNGVTAGKDYYCYKVVVREEIYQLTDKVSRATTSHDCEEHFKNGEASFLVGKYNGTSSDFVQHYSDGDVDRGGCPTRTAELKVAGDPTVNEGQSISVVEPFVGSCNYIVTLGVPPLMKFKSAWNPIKKRTSHQEKLQATLDKPGARSARGEFTPTSLHCFYEVVVQPTPPPKYLAAAGTNLDKVFGDGLCTKENQCAGFTFMPGIDPPVNSITVWFAKETKQVANTKCFSYTRNDEETETVDVVV